MKYYTILSLSLILIIFFACSVNDDDQNNLVCGDNGNEFIVGIWKNPKFISTSTNCYLNECIDLNLEFNSDSTYLLVYTIYDSQSNSIVRELNDQGNFYFNCEERGNLSGRFSALTYTKGKLTFNSDSIPQTEWNLERNGVEGLIIQPEYLGFTHNAYIKVN